MSRNTRIVLGTVLAAEGLTGTLAFGRVFPVTGQPGDPSTEVHEAMDARMDAMRGGMVSG